MISSFGCNPLNKESKSSSTKFVNYYQDPNQKALEFYLSFDENQGSSVKESTLDKSSKIIFKFSIAKHIINF
jgi:hypothetical protein